MSRRISYVLPAPDTPVPLLSLPALTEPRLGRTSPLLLQRSAGQPIKASRRVLSSLKDSTLNPDGSHHPRHCLGVAAIALDTSTQLAGRSAPQGILYTGGRDGLVAGWELGLPLSKRRRPRWSETMRPGERVRWERLELGDSGVSSTGGWGDDNEDADVDEIDSDLEQEDESVDGNSSDGHADQSLQFDDPGTNQKSSSGRGPSSRRRELEYTERWQLDKDALKSRPPPATAFRQSVQTHTDWVNDILLCNQNQTVISCSSDRTIRAWAPHDREKSASPDLIGIHRDYAKVISLSKHTNTLFSGGLDRQVYLWDVAQARPDEPISTLHFPDLIGGEGGKGSIYALTSNDAGTLVAAGSPERVVRLWDPRAAGSRGGQSIAGLIGHTDNIRAILLSQDGRHVRAFAVHTRGVATLISLWLWSLTAQRCLHTFNHHTDSVWSLYSDHPNFERFLSGDRAGHLATVDVTGCRNDYSDAECVLLAKVDVEEGRRGTEGICQIIGMDDEFVWTATGSASVSRWQDVGRKRDRLEAEVGRRELSATPPGHPSANEGNNQVPPARAPMVLVNGFIPPRNKTVTSGVGGNSPSPLPDSVSSDQRDSRTVAFAEDLGTKNPFDDPEDQHTEQQYNLMNRRVNTNNPVTNAAVSILSVAASHNSITEYAQGRNGIAYSHLVNLSQSLAPYEMSNNAVESNADASKWEAFAGSALSLRRSSLGQTAHVGLPSINGNMITPDAGDVARREFLEREIVIEADPLRVHPSEVICGRHGLIRALMLNDRQHALTVDTGGQVAVWNVIHGRCVGRYDEYDISGVYQESGYDLQDVAGRDSKEALDIVRERIEGESSTITWCTVDTRIGSLTVHVEENRCFDAEVYADEVGYRGDPAFKEDHRINLGKWALANLFAGLVKAEAEEIAQGSGATETDNTPERPAPVAGSVNRSPAPSFIALDRATSRRARSQSLLNNGPTTPGALMVGLATPAMTPAVLPPAGPAGIATTHGITSARLTGPRDVVGGLPIIPQSPATIASNAATPMSPSSFNTGLRSPKATEIAGPKDYFSIKTSKGTVSDRATQPTTPGASLSSSLPTQTPGGSFMGKFKGFGGKGKKSTGADVAAPVPIAPMPEESEDDASKAPPAPEREVAQLRLLSQIRAHGFQPPLHSEAPQIKLPADVALLISEESKEAGAWAVIYRSMVSRTEQDMEPLEMAAPGWVLEYLFAGRNRVKEPVKLCFVLEPWQGGDVGQRLQAMPANNARLTANRVLRIRKVLQYIHDKLELGHPNRRGSVVSLSSQARRTSHDSGLITAQSSDMSPTGGKVPVRFGAVEQARAAAAGKNTTSADDRQETEQSEVKAPEEVLEVLCNGVVVPISMTLAATKQYIWQAPGLAGGGSSGMDVVLQYRWRSASE